MLPLLLFIAAQASAPQTITAPADYPPEALRNGWQGDVALDLTVGINGRVTGCKILRSSGHKVLDDATCSILIKVSRFKPATGRDGRPVQSHYRHHIDWRLAK